MIDLGSLGGTGNGGGNLALNINNLGQVVGNSDLPGDTANHAFLWTRGKGMRDLGTLPGDTLSAGLGINDNGKIVGISLDANFNPRAFVWHNGVMTDLNTLIPDSSTLCLLIACSINQDGKIVGLRSGHYHRRVARLSRNTEMEVNSLVRLRLPNKVGAVAFKMDLITRCA